MIKPYTSINKKGIMLSTKAAIPNMGSAMPKPHYWIT